MLNGGISAPPCNVQTTLMFLTGVVGGNGGWGC